MSDDSRKISLARLLGEDAPDGRVCPDCGCRLHVTNTWQRRDGSLRRLLKCHRCSYSVNTTERPDDPGEGSP
jgi:hypothetical protein